MVIGSGIGSGGVGDGVIFGVGVGVIFGVGVGVIDGVGVGVVGGVGVIDGVGVGVIDGVGVGVIDGVGVGVIDGVGVGVIGGVGVVGGVGVGVSLLRLIRMNAIGIAAKPKRAHFGNPRRATSTSSQSQTSSVTMSMRVSVMTRSSCGKAAFFFVSSSSLMSSLTRKILSSANLSRVKFPDWLAAGRAFTICTTCSNLTGPADTLVKPASIDTTQIAAKTPLILKVFMTITQLNVYLKRNSRIPQFIGTHCRIDHSGIYRRPVRGKISRLTPGNTAF